MPALLAHWQGVRERRGATSPEHAPGVPLVFHPPCTLQHGQQLRGGVEQMLRALDFDVPPRRRPRATCAAARPAPIRCCSRCSPTQLRDRKLAALAAAQPEPRAIVSANIGCISHLQSRHRDAGAALDRAGRRAAGGMSAPGRPKASHRSRRRRVPMRRS